MSESNFKDEEIQEERRKIVSRSKNIDYDRLELKRALRKIIESGTLQDFEAKLIEIGKGPDTVEGQQFLKWFLSVRGSRPR